MCRHYGVTRSGYYSWLGRPESKRTRENKELLKRIEKTYEESHKIYGSPRVWATLRKGGESCGLNRIARLMSLAGLQGRVVRVTRRVPGVQKFYERNENLRLTGPVPDSINQQWVGDLTYIKTRERACYLATVMDLYSRRIVGWALGKDRTTALTCLALNNAIRQRDPDPGVIFHTDRGVEYGGIKLREILKRHGLLASMSRAYHSQDNAHMESFFHSMKIEWIRGKTFVTMDELKGALRHYIRFYNCDRLHSGIGYDSPVEYERKLI